MIAHTILGVLVEFNWQIFSRLFYLSYKEQGKP